MLAELTIISFQWLIEGGMYDEYNSDIACSLPGVHKLYNKLIAYQIFEIGFDRSHQCLKIDFEDFNETVAILKGSHWKKNTMLFFCSIYLN